ncbi:MAG: hypothetical protein ACM3JD_00275 [Rudaea sp.]
MNLFLLLSGSAVILVAALGLWWFRMMSRVHQHCIKVAGTAFMSYSMDHGGRLPYDTNGFGNAMLLLVKEGQLPGVAWICGPGDDGHALSNALVRGVHVPEAECSRIYVQGLSEKNDPNICILFDRRSVPGGDHFYGRGKPLREALLLDGSMQTVPDAQWPEFCRRQVELLVAAGFPRQKALKYYPEASVSK